ncbi:MAG: Periplasmic aromatic aldehyde oxidoreductase, iron-sulfur subunit YagT, partial [uncultured Craurococcus sp.]
GLVDRTHRQRRPAPGGAGGPEGHAARPAARAPAPDRHEEGLRPRAVRRVHRAAGRAADQRVPGARGRPRRRGRADDRGPRRRRRRVASGPSGVHRPRRAPVRVLHAWPGHERGGPDRGGARRQRPGAGARGHERQPVPVRGLRRDHGGGARRARPHGRAGRSGM